VYNTYSMGCGIYGHKKPAAEIAITVFCVFAVVCAVVLYKHHTHIMYWSCVL